MIAINNDQLPAYGHLEAIPPAILRYLLAMGPRLHATLNLKLLLDLVLQMGQELTGAAAAAALLLNEATNQLQFEAATNLTLSRAVIIPMDDSMAGWVVRNGRSLRLVDIAEDKRFASAVDRELQFGLHCLLGVPLHTDGKVFGVLEFSNKQDGFTDQDQAVVEALAAQAAVAIANARQFAQSDLLAEIVHELKTPMMAITTATGLLLRHDLPADKRTDLVEMIQRESLRLSEMTQDFLEFARLEAGRVRLACEPVNLATLVHEVVHIAQPQAAVRDIAIDADLPADLPGVGSPTAVWGDEARLKQALLNLVSNAIKYNIDHGRVAIRVQTNGQEASVSVEDTGAGIAPQDLGHLFDRFYRVPDSEQGSEGSGLGLAIAKKLVEQQNGRIVVDSILGQGTTFTLFLPLKAVAAP